MFTPQQLLAGGTTRYGHDRPGGSLGKTRGGGRDHADVVWRKCRTDVC